MSYMDTLINKYLSIFYCLVCWPYSILAPMSLRSDFLFWPKVPASESDIRYQRGLFEARNGPTILIPENILILILFGSIINLFRSLFFSPSNNTQLELIANWHEDSLIYDMMCNIGPNVQRLCNQACVSSR